MTKWVYLGIALALFAVTGVTGQLAWAGGGVLMLIATGLRLANDRRRAREAGERDEQH